MKFGNFLLVIISEIAIVIGSVLVVYWFTEHSLKNLILSLALISGGATIRYMLDK